MRVINYHLHTNPSFFLYQSYSILQKLIKNYVNLDFSINKRWNVLLMLPKQTTYINYTQKENKKKKKKTTVLSCLIMHHTPCFYIVLHRETERELICDWWNTSRIWQSSNGCGGAIVLKEPDIALNYNPFLFIYFVILQTQDCKDSIHRIININIWNFWIFQNMLTAWNYPHFSEFIFDKEWKVFLWMKYNFYVIASIRKLSPSSDHNSINSCQAGSNSVGAKEEKIFLK